MSKRIPEEPLAPWVGVGTRLLRVESHGPRALSLRFDRGELQVLLEDHGIALEFGGAAPLSAEAELLDESDPWWTVIGQPLCGASAQFDAEQRRTALELQFRPDGENPKLVIIEPRGARLRARGMPKAQWDGAQ